MHNNNKIDFIYMNLFHESVKDGDNLPTRAGW